MATIDNIVSVSVTRQTQSVSQKGFGVPMIIGEFATTKTSPAFTRSRLYGSTEEMISDGWSASDAEYKGALALLAQNPKVPEFYIGRLDSTDATIAEGLDAIVLEENDWYCGLPVGVKFDKVATTSNQEDFADWIATKAKIAIIQSTDVNLLDGAEVGDIATLLQAKANDRVAVIYHILSKEDEYANCAWAGECLPYAPGSQTWAFKTLGNVTFDSFTTAEENDALNKDANIYLRIGGLNKTIEGTMASGEYIDIIRGVDWLTARIQEAEVTLITTNRKIDFDDTGITLVQGTLDGVLSEAVSAGVLQAGSVSSSAPKYADIPQADKSNRHLPDVTFEGILLGAIQSTTIKGVVTL